MAESDKIGNGGNCKNKMIKKSLYKNLNGATDYLIPNVKQVFIYLRQVLIKALIFWYLDLKCYI